MRRKPAPASMIVRTAVAVSLVAAAASAAAPPPPRPAPGPAAPVAAAELAPIVILGTRIESRPEGREITTVPRAAIEKTDAFDLKDLVDSVPGLFTKQSNGPRDVTLSIRGSGAKTSFAVRNIKIYEDWFPTTQSDGLSRTDIHDPNAYEGIDVIRGPSSAQYGNYALGGVLNLRSRPGADVDGLDVGDAAGSYGYHNHYVHFGQGGASHDYAVFGSLVRGDGYIRHSGFTTVTENLTATLHLDDKRRLVLKLLNNDLRSEVPSRLSKAEFDADSRGAGTTNATGVGVVSAEQAAQRREDRRTILGARFEDQLDGRTGLRFLGAYDVKDINQTFGTISDNVNPNFHQYADLTREGTLFGKPAKHLGGVFFDYMEQEAESFRNLADFEGTRGALQSNTRGHHMNAGALLREELRVAPEWNWILGLGAERSEVLADVRSRTAAETYARVSVDRKFWNAAPETSLVWEPRGDLKVHARAAMGYGVPGIGQLTTTSDGLAGNNTGLKPQRNLGFEVGAAGTGAGALHFDVAAYYELFYNEFVTQSPGSGLSSFTSNAPRSDHRGVEVLAELRPELGVFVSGAYTFNDHVYRAFDETLGPGVVLDRRGRKIPGVEEHLVNAKLGFAKKNLPGGWLELNHVSGFWLNNANTLRADPYTVFNLNLNYSREATGRWFKAFTVFFDLRNVFDLTYEGSAIAVADTAADTPASLLTKQAFFAGQGRTLVGGVKFHF